MVRKLIAGGILMMACGAKVSAESVIDLPGKIYDVDLKKGTCRFLVQDVQPDGLKGRAWYTAKWSSGTTFEKFETVVNMHKVEGRFIAIFSKIDDKNMAALQAGEKFRADKLVLRPDLDTPSGLDVEKRTVTGWFTPRSEKFSRDGILELDGKKINAGAKYGPPRISICESLEAEAISKGCWRAMLTGYEDGGRINVEHMSVQPLVDPREVDDPKLPRVLSVGDSISMNYEAASREALKGIANYHRIEDNCWSTRRGMTFMPYWLGDYEKKGLHWDVILFNSGLHDMKQKELRGDYSVPLSEYKQNLRNEIEIMKKTGATLIFCTTTPVQNDSGNANYAFRTKGAEKDFNDAAREVLKDYPEILINDLAEAVYESSEFDNWRTKKDVHFYKDNERAVLGAAVADAVGKALSARNAPR